MNIPKFILAGLAVIFWSVTLEVFAFAFFYTTLIHGDE
jgi:hypothetical protein